MSIIKTFFGKFCRRNQHTLLQPLLLSLLFVSILILLTAEDSATVFNMFFLKPFQSWWYFGTMLNKFSLLLFSAAGALFALKTKHLNLGGEGQIYIGGFVTAVLLAQQSALPSWFQFIVVMLIAMVLSGGIGFISAILKKYFDASELVTTFLISAVLLTAISAAIGGRFRDASANLLATAPIAEVFRLKPFASPATVNASLIFALLIPFAIARFFYASSWGYKLHTSGVAPEFAAASGFRVGSVSIVSMSVSAALHGLTGFFSIVGTWYVCHSGFHGGMGWAALAIALMAGDSFLALIPAALFYAWIESASQACVMSGSLRFNIALFFQAGLYLLVSARNISFKNLHRKLTSANKQTQVEV